MPLFDEGEKTEAPTPRKRTRAREQGNVAKSQDLNVAFLLLAMFSALYFLGFPSVTRLAGIMRDMLGRMAAFDGGQDSLMQLFGVIAWSMLQVIVPFALVMLIVGVIANISQIGFLLTTEPLKPNLNKISPLRGLSKIFSLRGVTRTLFGVLKISVVGFVLVWTLWDELTRSDGKNVMLLLQSDWRSALEYGLGITVKMGFRGVIALLILAIIDLIYQRWQHERDLRMTKQEVREEMLRMEGDPKIKERRRKIQQQLATQRMMHEVPKADVVVTNPTHYSVAIKYDRRSMPAPRCVAKGEGHLARRIREVAMEHAVPIVSRPELARALYRSVEVGEEIPAELYRAVAEVLAFVYRMSRRSPLSTSAEVGSTA